MRLYQQAVGGLDYRQAIVREGNTHHRPSHHQAGIIITVLISAGKVEQRGNGCAVGDADILWLGDGFTGDSDDAADEWDAINNGIGNGGSGCHIMADDADGEGTSLRGNLFAGEYLNELSLTTGGVEGGYQHQFDIVFS